MKKEIFFTYPSKPNTVNQCTTIEQSETIHMISVLCKEGWDIMNLDTNDEGIVVRMQRIFK